MPGFPPRARLAASVAALVLVAAAAAAGGAHAAAADLPVTPCDNATEFRALNASTDMPASIGSMVVAVPFEVLYPVVSDVKLLPSWNPLFVRVNQSSISLCSPFNADYSNAPKLPFPAGITGPHQIVQLSNTSDGGLMAWNFKIIAADGHTVLTRGRHQMRFEATTNEAGSSATRFVSYEKAAGALVKPYRQAWTVALQQSLIDTLVGLSCLEQLYLDTGALEPAAVVSACVGLPPVSLTADLPK